MIEILDPEPGEMILDPACGSGASDHGAGARMEKDGNAG